MALLNYSGIKDAVEDWLNRGGYSEITVRSPDFIEMGQRRLMRTVRVPPMENATVLSIDANGDSAIPTDLLEIKELVATKSDCAWALQRATIAEVMKARNNSSYVTPTVFDTAGATLYVGSAPVQGEVITLYYYRELEFVSSTVPENWFSKYAPELILFSALSEAGVFMKDPALSEGYEAKLNQSIDLLNAQQKRGEHSGSPLSVRLG